MAVKGYLMERKIPWVGPSAGSLQWITPPQKYLFGVYPLYYKEARTLVRHAVEKMGLKRVAVAYQNDEYGKNGLRGAKEELGKQGLEIVAEVPVEIKDSDMKPHVMKLRKSNADMVLLWTSVSHAVRIVGVSKAMKFAPQFMSTSTCSDFPLMMHISKGLWEGVICATFGELPDSDDPLLKTYKEEAYGAFAAKDERWGLFFYAGILFAEPMVEAIKRCGPELTREKLVKELEGLKNFKGIGPSITYKPFDPNDPSCRQGGNETILVQCLADGKSKKLSDWIVMTD
jgi:ABC-type branched-subunit amino acid transport system substrate-binding protein